MITISQIYRPLGVTAKRVEFLAFQNGIKFDRKRNAAAKFTDDAAQRLIEIIKREKEVDEYASVSDVAKQLNIYQAIVNSYMTTLKIKKHNRGFWAYVAKVDIPRILEHHDKVMKDKNATKEVVARREYYRMRYQIRKERGEYTPQCAEERRRLGIEAELYAIKQAKEQRIRELTVEFRHKDGKIYTGIIIGGLDRVNEHTAMIRYIDQGIKKIAEPLYHNILNKSFNQVAGLVALAKSERKE